MYTSITQQNSRTSQKQLFYFKGQILPGDLQRMRRVLMVGSLHECIFQKEPAMTSVRISFSFARSKRKKGC